MQAAHPFDALANVANGFYCEKAFPSLFHAYGNHLRNRCLAGDILEAASRSSDCGTDDKTASSKKRRKLLTVASHSREYRRSIKITIGLPRDITWRGETGRSASRRLVAPRDVTDRSSLEVVGLRRGHTFRCISWHLPTSDVPLQIQKRQSAYGDERDRARVLETGRVGEEV
jgi:hypothetical protein